MKDKLCPKVSGIVMSSEFWLLYSNTTKQLLISKLEEKKIERGRSGWSYLVLPVTMLILIINITRIPSPVNPENKEILKLILGGNIYMYFYIHALCSLSGRIHGTLMEDHPPLCTAAISSVPFGNN